VLRFSINEEEVFNPFLVVNKLLMGVPFFVLVCSLYVAFEVFEIIQILARGNGQKQIFSKIQHTQKRQY
jgi:ABC-type sugar transport system permease subunit